MERLPVELETRLAEICAVAEDDGTALVTEDGAIKRLERRGMLEIEESYINGQARVALTPEGEDYESGFLGALISYIKEHGPGIAVEIASKLLGL